MKILPEEEVEEKYNRIERAKKFLLFFLSGEGREVFIEMEKELGIMHILFVMEDKKKSSTENKIVNERYVNDIVEIICNDFHLKPLGKSIPVFLANTIRYDVMIE